MILVTGAFGFIGYNLLKRLHAIHQTVVASDCLELMANSTCQRERMTTSRYADVVIDVQDILTSPRWKECTGVIHLGAISSSVHKDWNTLLRLNVEFSKMLFTKCADLQIPFVYASSASTYGQDGSNSDDDELPVERKGLSLYARSKWLFDRWALEQTHVPPNWAGLKFFCVYGLHEEHKGPQASIFHKSVDAAFKALPVVLFETKQSPIRDFVYVEDVCDACIHFLYLKGARGTYNVGTEQGFEFESIPGLVNVIMDDSKMPSALRNWVYRRPFPEDIAVHYQHLTCASSPRAKAAGFTANTMPYAGAALMIQAKLQTMMGSVNHVLINGSLKEHMKAYQQK